MHDLPPLERCPVEKHGRHELSVVLPEDADHDMTLFCSHCGVVRRMPVNGALHAGSLDDWPASRIADEVRRA